MEMSKSPQIASSLPSVIRFYRVVWRLWKERRFKRFVRTLNPNEQDRLLDIGGYPFNWFNRGGICQEIDVLNLEASPIGELPAGAPVIRAIAGDARHLDLPDSSYDIVFSNSVIEHVGSFADQRDFAEEARRVGGALWVQTPAWECPVEPHFLGLFIHWLPRAWHARAARWFSVRGLSGASDARDLKLIAGTTRLLSKNEMRRLFPDCEIWTERMFLLIPKSHVAIRKREKALTFDGSLPK